MSVSIARGVSAIDPIPDQTGHAGEVLGTDGENLSWVAGGGGGGGNPTLTEVEVSLATTKPTSNGTFNISSTGLTAGKLINIQQSPGPYTGKGTLTDEIEMDQIHVTGYVVDATTIKCNWGCSTKVLGNVKFNYFVGG